MKQEEILHFFIVLFCSCLIVAFVIILPLEIIHSLFEWQPYAGRVLVYGIALVLCFHKGCEDITVEKVEKDDDDWDE